MKNQAPGVRYEFVGDDVFVLDADTGVVHRVSGDSADRVRGATDEVSRRRALKLALAAGVGVTTMALPAAAAAASGVSGSGSGGGAAVAPNAPTNFAATEGDGQVLLSWTAPATGTVPTSYKVTRTETYGSASPVVTTVDASTTLLTVTGLTNNKSYTFTLVATAATLDSSSVQVTAVPDSPALSSVSLLSSVDTRPTAVLITRASAPPTGEVDYITVDSTAEALYGSNNTKTVNLSADTHTIVIKRRRTSDSVDVSVATINLEKRQRRITPADGVVTMKVGSSPYRPSRMRIQLWGSVGGKGGNAGAKAATAQSGCIVVESAGFVLTAGDTLLFAAGEGGANGTSDVASANAGTGGGAGGTNALGGYSGGRGGHVGSGFTTAGGGGGGGAATVLRHTTGVTTTDYVASGSGGGGGGGGGAPGGTGGTVGTSKDPPGTGGARGANSVTGLSTTTTNGTASSTTANAGGSCTTIYYAVAVA